MPFRTMEQFPVLPLLLLFHAHFPSSFFQILLPTTPCTFEPASHQKIFIKNCEIAKDVRFPLERPTLLFSLNVTVFMKTIFSVQKMFSSFLLEIFHFCFIIFDFRQKCPKFRKSKIENRKPKNVENRKSKIEISTQPWS